MRKGGGATARCIERRKKKRGNKGKKRKRGGKEPRPRMVPTRSPHGPSGRKKSSPDAAHHSPDGGGKRLRQERNEFGWKVISLFENLRRGGKKRGERGGIAIDSQRGKVRATQKEIRRGAKGGRSTESKRYKWARSTLLSRRNARGWMANNQPLAEYDGAEVGNDNRRKKKEVVEAASHTNSRNFKKGGKTTELNHLVRAGG